MPDPIPGQTPDKEIQPEEETLSASNIDAQEESTEQKGNKVKIDGSEKDILSSKLGIEANIEEEDQKTSVFERLMKLESDYRIFEEAHQELKQRIEHARNNASGVTILRNGLLVSLIEEEGPYNRVEQRLNHELTDLRRQYVDESRTKWNELSPEERAKVDYLEDALDHFGDHGWGGRVFATTESLITKAKAGWPKPQTAEEKAAEEKEFDRTHM